MSDGRKLLLISEKRREENAAFAHPTRQRTKSWNSPISLSYEMENIVNCVNQCWWCAKKDPNGIMLRYTQPPTSAPACNGLSDSRHGMAWFNREALVCSSRQLDLNRLGSCLFLLVFAERQWPECSTAADEAAEWGDDERVKWKKKMRCNYFSHRKLRAALCRLFAKKKQSFVFNPKGKRRQCLGSRRESFETMAKKNSLWAADGEVPAFSVIIYNRVEVVRIWAHKKS